MAKNKLIQVKHFRQTPGFCGPASLKILFSHYGQDYSENKLAKLAHATRQYGTEHEGLIEAAKKLGAQVFEKEHATIKDLATYLKKDTPVIVGWFSNHNSLGDHYSVVIGLTDTHVILSDPERDRAITKIKRDDFKNCWFDFVGQDNKTVSWGWLMGISSIE